MTDERKERDDAMLSAYLDGELSHAESEELAGRFAEEPELAERLEAMRSMDEAVNKASRSIDDVPMPSRVLELLGAGETGVVSPGRHADNVVQLPRPAVTSFFQWPVAIAASVALVFGFYLNSAFDSGAPIEEFQPAYANRIPADSDLGKVFDSGLSNEPAALSEGREAMPLLTFQDTAGHYCRQVRITGASKVTDTLACRRQAHWEMEIVTFEEVSGIAPDGQYGQASSGTSAAMDAAIDRIIGQEPPLGRDDEAAIIDNRWQKNANDSR